MRELQARRGYQEISTPILVHKKLWQQSGHWDLYDDNMFLRRGRGPDVQPQADELPRVARSSTARRVRSYRDLPLRFNEYGRLHRNERSGTLSRADARPPVHPGRRAHLRPAGPAGRRDRGAARRGPRGRTAGSASSRASRSRTKPGQGARRPGALGAGRGADPGGARRAPASSYTVKPKDGTFYAPKIDIYIDDALGREWQMATIQVDLTMLPERFDLTYIDEHGQPQRPIAIHRAIYGSLERFIGILIEHFAGAFPLWLRAGPGGRHPDRRPPHRGGRASSPPCSARAACGSRSTTPTTGCRTRSGSPRSRRCPYMLVLGDREIEARTARRRGRGAGRAAGPAEPWDDARRPRSAGARPHARRTLGSTGPRPRLSARKDPVLSSRRRPRPGRWPCRARQAMAPNAYEGDKPSVETCASTR